MPSKIGFWLVIIALAAVLFILMRNAEICTPGHAAGPTIGGVVKIQGC